MTKVNRVKCGFVARSMSSILHLAREKLLPVILHVLLSAAFVILIRQSEQEQSWLTRIIEFLEPKYLQSINRVNVQFLISTLIQFRSKCKLSER